MSYFDTVSDTVLLLHYEDLLLLYCGFIMTLLRCAQTLSYRHFHTDTSLHFHTDPFTQTLLHRHFHTILSHKSILHPLLPSRSGYVTYAWVRGTTKRQISRFTLSKDELFPLF